MKRFFIIICFAYMGCNMSLTAALTINMHKNNADPDIAEYIQSTLAENLSYLNDKQLDVTLSPNGDALTISYQISPEGWSGQETSNDVWTDLDYTIQRIVSAIHANSSSAPKQSASGNVSNTQPTQTISSAQYQQYPQQQYPQQQYTQQTQPQNQTQTPPVTSQKKSIGNKFMDAVMSSALVKVDAKQNVLESAKLFQTPQYTMADVRKGQVSVGGCLTFNDGTKGIIYYLDNQGHGLVVSLDNITAKWENVNKSKECHDILMLPNEEGVEVCTYGVGANNTSTIINQLGIYNAPAAAWCISHGDGWYLPSCGELWYLFAIANAKSGAGGLISLSVINAGGAPLDKKWYWSSSENDKDEAINVSLWGSMSSENKINSVDVRAIRAF